MKSIFGKTYLIVSFLAMPYFCYFAGAGEKQEETHPLQEQRVDQEQGMEKSHVQQEKPRKGRGLYALAAGLAIALAAFGGALGQSRVGASAMEGIARNPQSQKIMFTPMIIALALIESCVIFSFVIAMIIAAQIP